MQTLPQKQTRERLPFPISDTGIGKSNNMGNRVRRIHYYNLAPLSSSSSSSARARSICTCSNKPGSVRCSKHGYVVPNDKMRKHQASKEILRRALTPPHRKMSLRWWNFRPTPSRLSNMSMA
ncbi:uncharacterized protein LOC126669726 [Mercurialis annua]|uniref:uncharacterized protein LOC126669726 n=1 Tax=Mercurialis annua TaxID=3986 RepID=UPI00215E16DB|nr:uncharacterized protein LOC126669726 [Mercurialis annua]